MFTFLKLKLKGWGVRLLKICNEDVNKILEDGKNIDLWELSVVCKG